MAARYHKSKQYAWCLRTSPQPPCTPYPDDSCTLASPTSAAARQRDSHSAQQASRGRACPEISSDSDALLQGGHAVGLHNGLRGLRLDHHHLAEDLTLPPM